MITEFCVIIIFWFITEAEGMHDGRICCRHKNSDFHPSGITYIESLDFILSVDAKGYVQMSNLTEHRCGSDKDSSPARGTRHTAVKPPLVFEGVTSRKGDSYVVYAVDRGTVSRPPRIHFLDFHRMKVFKSIPLYEVPTNTRFGAGSITWVPDGTKDGRFLVGSKINGQIYSYKLIRTNRRGEGVDNYDFVASLIEVILPPETVEDGVQLVELSGLSYEPSNGDLWVMHHEGYWGFHIYEFDEKTGRIGAFKHKKKLLASLQGGSPPFKHEGIAVLKMPNSRTYKIFTADRHRYIYESRYKYGGARFVACPFVFVRIDGCCFRDRPCELIPENECKKRGGRVKGKTCEQNTCADYGPLGCPTTSNENVTWVDRPNGGCGRCYKPTVGGQGCKDCHNINAPTHWQVQCDVCMKGYYLWDNKCTRCHQDYNGVTGARFCTQCHKYGGNMNVVCYECTGGLLENGACLDCGDPTRGKVGCSTCTHSAGIGSNFVCSACHDGFMFNQYQECTNCTEKIPLCELCSKNEANWDVVCNKCMVGFYLEENKCVSSCSKFYYESKVGIDGNWDSGIKICVECEPDNHASYCTDWAEAYPEQYRAKFGIVLQSEEDKTLHTAIAAGILFSFVCVVSCCVYLLSAIVIIICGLGGIGPCCSKTKVAKVPGDDLISEDLLQKSTDNVSNVESEVLQEVAQKVKVEEKTVDVEKPVKKILFKKERE